MGLVVGVVLKSLPTLKILSNLEPILQVLLRFFCFLFMAIWDF